MLWFLAIAARCRFRVDRYFDAAGGVMAKTPDGRMYFSVVTLRPEVRFSADPQPRREDIDAMHAEAHHQCFIANSVRTEIRCEPVYPA
jgi:organic hydroperoxide reductase OsmC/OhrA